MSPPSTVASTIALSASPIHHTLNAQAFLHFIRHRVQAIHKSFLLKGRVIIVDVVERCTEPVDVKFPEVHPPHQMLPRLHGRQQMRKDQELKQRLIGAVSAALLQYSGYF